MAERTRKGARDDRATLPQVPRAKQARATTPAEGSAPAPRAGSGSRRRKGTGPVVEEIQAPATGRDRRRE
jgi:hypothetical protein